MTPAAPEKGKQSPTKVAEKPVIKVKSFATVPEEETKALAKPLENKVRSLNLLIIMHITIDETS